MSHCPTLHFMTRYRTCVHVALSHSDDNSYSSGRWEKFDYTWGGCVKYFLIFLHDWNIVEWTEVKLQHMFSASEESTNILQPPLSLHRVFDLQKIDFRWDITLKLKSIAHFQTAKMMECLVLHLFDPSGLVNQLLLQFWENVQKLSVLKALL